MSARVKINATIIQLLSQPPETSKIVYTSVCECSQLRSCRPICKTIESNYSSIQTLHLSIFYLEALMMNPPTPIDGTLRKFALRIPSVISQCSGITIIGKLYRSIVFSTDLAIIRNINADAIMAVYPFTPQPVITQAIISASDIPVFAGVGGGLTQGKRVIHMASYAEMQGAIGVVVNAPTQNDVIRELTDTIDIPVIVTIAREDTDIQARVAAGMRIANVSAAAETANVVRKIRESFPELPIIATGGPTEETIRETIEAGANAITWTAPSSGEIFKSIMTAYRAGEAHP